MKKWLGMWLVALVATIVTSVPARAFEIDTVYTYCKYRDPEDFTWRYRDGQCQNNDKLYAGVRIIGDGPLDTGNVFINVYDQSWGYPVAWLKRPRFVNGMGGQNGRYFEISLGQLNFGASQDGSLYRYIVVVVTGVTAMGVDIGDDNMTYVSWQVAPLCPPECCDFDENSVCQQLTPRNHDDGSGDPACGCPGTRG